MLESGTTGIIVLLTLFGMLGVGVHIGVSLGLCGILGTYLAIGPDAAWAHLATIPFSTTNSFTLAVIPLFILMGSLATQAGLTTDLYCSFWSRKWFYSGKCGSIYQDCFARNDIFWL